jgi:hypothetical protein
MPLQLREAKIETSIDDRKQRRHRLLLEAEGGGHETASGAVLVHDISDTGLLIETIYALGIGEMIEVNHPCAGVLMEAEIMWAAGQIYGCKFTRERTQAAVSAEQRGGRFSLTHAVANAGAADAVADAPKDATAEHDASTERLSRGRKYWVNVGLVLSLWIIAHATIFLLYETGSMAIMDIGAKYGFGLWELGPPPLLKQDWPILLKNKINRHDVRNAYVDRADACSYPMMSQNPCTYAALYRVI